MKESYNQGLAAQIGSESNMVVGNGRREALTGVCAGPVLSLEASVRFPSADVLLAHGRPHHAAAKARREGAQRG